MRLYSEGYASSEDIDATIKDGLGLRWAFMGPFETIELNAPEGVSDYFSRYGPVFAKMARSSAGAEIFAPERTQKIAASWKGQLAPSKIAARSRWRNERLAALVRHKAKQKNEM